MATDSTNLPQGETIVDAGTDMAASELELAGLQLAQTEPVEPAAVPGVQANVLIIQVRPGQVVTLPIADATGVPAKFGPEGNLAFVIDGRTIILQGYVKADEQQPIKIVTSDGDVVIPAELVADTDQTLDIQTAAGGAAGPQGDTAATGSGIFTPFAAGDGLGGFGAEGVLSATALAYKNIDDEREVFTERDEDQSPDFTVTFDVLGGLINEDDLPADRPEQEDQLQAAKLILSDAGKDGEGNDPFDNTDNENQDGDTDGDDHNDNGVDDDREPVVSVATVNVNFHGDTPGTLEVDLSQLPTDLTSEGEPVVFELVPAQDGVHGNGILAFVDSGLDGHYDAGVDRLVFEVHVDKDKSEGEFKVTFTLHDNLDNAPSASLIGSEEQVQDLPVKFLITDSDGTTVAGLLPLGVEDDRPFFGELTNDAIGLNIVDKDPHVTNDESLLPIADPSDATPDDDQTILDPDAAALLLSLGNKVNNAGFSVPTLGESIGTLTVPNLAQTQVKVSFGADGPTTQHQLKDEDPEARNSIFGELTDKATAGDGVNDGSNELPYELFMVQNGHGQPITDSDLTITDQMTGNTVTWNGDIKNVFLHQIDANTIVGYINKDDAPDGKQAFDIESNQEVVFVINIDDNGVLSFVQLHQLNHDVDGPTPADHDDSLPIVGTDGTPLVYVRASDSDGDHVVKPIDLKVEDDGPCFIGVIGSHKVDEDGGLFGGGLPGGNPGGPGDDNGLLTGKSAAGLIVFSTGEDRPGDLTIAELKITDHNDVEIALADLKTADGTPVQILKSGDSWIGHTGNPADPVFVFELSAAGQEIGSAGYTFTLNKPLQHGLTDDPSTKGTETAFEDDLKLDFTVRATDVDGDYAEGGVQIVIDDDSPKATTKESAIDLRVDESVNANPAFEYDDPNTSNTTKDGTKVEGDESIVGSLPAILTNPALGAVIGAVQALGSGAFNISPGADGLGSAVYGLTLVSSNSGLTDTLSGQPITLVDVGGGVIQGQVASGPSAGAVVFALTIDPATSQISMAQYRAVHHGGPDTPSQPDEVISLGSGKITVDVTVTDRDGDAVTSHKDLGSSIRFEDDGPKTVLTVNSGAQVIVDESVGGLPNDNDEVGQGKGVIGYGTVQGSVLFTDTTDFGSDGPAVSGSKSYALILDGAAPIDSGLVDTASNAAVILTLSGGEILGKVSGSGELVFKISIDTTDGDTTVTQYRAVKHDDPNDADEASSPELLDTGHVFAQITVKDGDTDTATGKVDLASVVKFEDDGPKADLVKITVDDGEGGDGNLTHDETTGVNNQDDVTGPLTVFDGLGLTALGFAQTHVNVNLDKGGSGNPNAAYGSDGPGTTDLSLTALGGGAFNGAQTNLHDTATGLSIFLFTQGDLVVGKVGADAISAAAGPVAFALSLDDAGNLSLAQYRAIQHPDAPSNFDEPVALLAADGTTAVVQITAIVTDKDGDQVKVELPLDGKNGDNGIIFEDDGPNAEMIASTGVLILDETVGGAPNENDETGSPLDTDDIGYAKSAIGSLFVNNASTGVDGGTVAYTLQVGAGASGLIDTETNEQVVFTVNVSGEIEGHVGGTNGPLVMLISINAADGTVEVHQYRAVVHDDPLDADEAGASAAGIGANVINIVQTVTDGDGDKDTDTFDLGVRIKIEDDGPKENLVSIKVDPTGDGNLIHDETSGIDGKDDVAAAPSAIAAYEVGKGLSSIGYAQTTVTVDLSGGDPLTPNAAFGSDGPGTSALKLTQSNGADFTGQLTNLVDTATGRAIHLFTQDGVVVGRVADAVGNPDPVGDVAFVLSLNNSGSFELGQYRAIQHPDITNPDDSVTLLTGGTAGPASALVYASVIVTDDDGDFVTKSIPIDGKGSPANPAIKFEDDGPTAFDDTDRVLEGNTQNAYGNVVTGVDTGINLFGDPNGEDGNKDAGGTDGIDPASVVWADTKEAGGKDTNGVIVGKYGTLNVNANGDYEYVLDQTNVDVIKLGKDATISEDFFYSVADNDGDRDDAKLTITIVGTDEGVEIKDLTPQSEGDSVVFEKGLPTRPGEPAGSSEAADGNGADNDDPSELGTGNFTVKAPDGVNDVTIHGVLVIDNGVLVPGPIVIVTPLGNQLTITGYTPEPGNVGGSITYEYLLKDNEDHPNAGGANSLFDDMIVTLNDVDGSSANGTLSIRIVDDLPSITEASASFSIQVDETLGGGADVDANGANFTQQDGSAAENDEVAGAAAVNAAGLPIITLIGASTAATAGLFNVIPGADDLASKVYTIAVTGDGVTGLTATASGTSIVLVSDGAGGVVGKDNGGTGAVIFAFKIDATSGQVTMAQYGAVDHGSDGVSSYPDETATIASGKLGVTLTVTDKDGDQAQATRDISGGIVFDDDGPSINVTQTNEANIKLNTQDADTIGGASDTAVSTANFSGVFAIGSQSFGADGAGVAPTLSYGLGFAGGFTEGQASGLKIGGSDIFLWQDVSGKIVGSTANAEINVNAGNTVFEVSVAADGKVTLTQHQQVDHLNPENAPTYDDDEIALANGKITLTASATITDKDGDSATDKETIDLGGNLVFDDDGPSINVTQTNEANIKLNTQDADTIGGASDTAVSTANFSGVFAIGSQSFGADGAGVAPTLSYGLGFAGGFTEGQASGLKIGGSDIFLWQDVSGKIVGSTANAEINVNAGNTVFEVSVAADGKVTLTQHQQVDHLNPENAPTYDDDEIALANGKITLTASATITDKDGDSATDKETIDLGGNLVFDDDGPSISIAFANGNTLDDEGSPLPGFTGIAGATTGVDVAGAPNTVTFAVTSNAGADGSISGVGFDLAAIQSQNSGLRAIDKTADGAPIVFSIDGGTGDLIGTISEVGSPLNGTIALRVHATGGGNYEVKELSPLFHTGQGEDPDLNFNVVMKITDKEGDSNTATAVVKIDDDQPVATPQSGEAEATPRMNTNLLLVLDDSGSMVSGGSGTPLQNINKLEALEAAVNELMEQYGNLGDVRICFVRFDTTASAQTNPGGEIWLTIDEAKTILAGLAGDGNTNYDEALLDAIAAYQTNAGADHKLTAADVTGPIQNVGYFISDGEPNTNVNWSSNPYNVPGWVAPASGAGVGASDGVAGINTEEEYLQNFLNQEDIKMYSIGIGSGINDTARDNLKRISYDGTGAGTNDDASLYIELTDLSQLTQTLVGTVVVPISGNIGGFGADGGYVSQVSISGVTANYNGTTLSLIDPAGGVVALVNPPASPIPGGTDVVRFTLVSGSALYMNMLTGAWQFVPVIGDNTSYDFAFTITDYDGDTSSNTLTVSTEPAGFKPIVRDDTIFSDVTNAGGAETIIVQAAALLWNDTDRDGDALTISGTFSNLNSLNSVTLNGSNVEISDNSGGGSFTYSASSTGGSDTGKVTLLRDIDSDGNDISDVNPLNGDGLDNILINDNEGDTINAYQGNDVLLGNGGNDTLNGGDGRDWLVGGAGNDILVGGTGNDLIDVSQDNDTVRYTSKLDGSDVITGFDAVGGAGAQDVIDLNPLFDTLGIATGSRSALVQITDNGVDTTVKVDVDGVAGFGANDITILVLGVTGLSKGNTGAEDINLGSS